MRFFGDGGSVNATHIKEFKSHTNFNLNFNGQSLEHKTFNDWITPSR